MKNKKTIVLAAGGTGGHVFPAMSLASELIARDCEVILIADSRSSSYSDMPKKLKVMVISSSSLSGGLVGKVKAVVKLVIGFFQARKILRQVKPYAVVGFGGYPSFPTMMAAKFTTAIKVIHEQNSILGKVNRVMASGVDKIATSFERVSGVKDSDAVKITFTGNPVRPAIKALREIVYVKPEDGGCVNILVTGGSQGAKIFSDIVPEALKMLPDAMRVRIRIDQQCRAEDIENVREIYKAAKINANLATFFDDIPSKLAATHLVIARAGASTISELTVAGRPAILIPYMYAADDHQTSNAKELAKSKAIVVLEQKSVTAGAMSETIKELLENPETLAEMAKNAFDKGVTDASERLADLVLS